MFAILFLSLLRYCSATCDTFVESCACEIGKPLQNGEYFDTSRESRVYFSLPLANSVTSSLTEIDVEASLLYGNVLIYAAYDRKPKLNDHDFSSALQANQDMLNIALTDVVDGVATRTSAAALNIVIVSLSPAKFAATVTSHNVNTELKLGLPFQDSITLTTTSGVHRDPNYIGEVQYYFRSGSVSPFTIGLTSLSDSTSHGNMDLYVASRGNAARAWNTASSTSSHLDGSLIITPLANEEFNINVKFEPPTVFQGNTSGTTNSPAQAHIVGGSVTNTFAFSVLVSQNTDLHQPVQLLGGYLQEGISDTVVSAETPLYYRLYVPPGREDVVISLDSIVGDSDLYVNPSTVQSGTSASCFYVPSDPSSALPLWYSHESTGLDAVVINPGNGGISAGGYYCITVFAHGFSRFRVRGYTSSTVITLTEGAVLYDHISQDTYHYYRFTDLQQPLEGAMHSLVFDASPVTGDSDLYVGCDVVPSGDDDGYPSKTLSHFNYSSASYSEDVVTISPLASNPKSCLSLRGSNTYFLAVYGFTDTIVHIAAAHENGIKTLTEGIPLNDQTLFKNTKIGRAHV